MNALKTETMLSVWLQIYYKYIYILFIYSKYICILGPLFFLLYINDLPKIITKNNSMVLFADDTGLLISDFNDLDFSININQSFQT